MRRVGNEKKGKWAGPGGLLVLTPLGGGPEAAEGGPARQVRLSLSLWLRGGCTAVGMVQACRDPSGVPEVSEGSRGSWCLRPGGLERERERGCCVCRSGTQLGRVGQTPCSRHTDEWSQIQRGGPRVLRSRGSSSIRGAERSALLVGSVSGRTECSSLLRR